MLGKKKQVARSALGAALILAFTVAPGAFAADEKGWYMGGSVGQSKVSIDKGATEAAFTSGGFATASATSDETDTAWKLFGGYQFTKNWAVEIAYVDLGTASVNIATTGTTAQYKAEASGKGWSFAGVGTATVSDTLGVFGKLGAFNWELDYTCGKVSGTGNPCTTPSASPSGTDLVYGIGMKYNFTKQTGLRVEWEQYKNIGDKNKTGESDVDLISVGIQFKF